MSNLGSHGEAFAAILIDKFIIPGIIEENIIFKLPSSEEYILSSTSYQSITKGGGSQDSDLFFSLTFVGVNDKTKVYHFYLYVEAKTYLSGNSSNDIKKSASELVAKVKNISYNDIIGSAYCIFIPFEMGVDDICRKLLDEYVSNNPSFPDSYFEITDKNIQLEKLCLESFLKDFESIPDIIANKEIKAWKTISSQPFLVSQLTAKVEVYISHIHFLETIKKFSQGLQKGIDDYFSNEKRRSDIQKFALRNESFFKDKFPNNTIKGFKHIGGDQDIFNESLKKATDDHIKYRLRKTTLIDKLLFAEEIQDAENHYLQEKSIIYEAGIENLAKGWSLERSILNAINEVLGSENHVLLEKSTHRKGLFYDWGSQGYHCLEFNNSFTLSIL